MCTLHGHRLRHFQSPVKNEMEISLNNPRTACLLAATVVTLLLGLTLEDMREQHAKGEMESVNYAQLSG